MATYPLTTVRVVTTVTLPTEDQTLMLGSNSRRRALLFFNTSTTAARLINLGVSDPTSAVVVIVPVSGSLKMLVEQYGTAIQCPIYLIGGGGTISCIVVEFSDVL